MNAFRSAGRASGGSGGDTLERPLDPEELRVLEEERDFLLRSLDDLEAELAVGNMYLDEYERLRDEYTSRAAVVLLSLDSGVDARIAAPPVSRARRVMVALFIITFVVGASWLLAEYLGERISGGTVTGNDQIDPAAALGSLEAAVEADPESVSARLDLARYLLQTDDLVGALQQFDEAYAIDATNPEAAAYSGWIRTIAADGVEDPAAREELYVSALERLDAAVGAASDYPDAHFFRGMTLCYGFGRTDEATVEWRRYLELTGPAAPRGGAVAGLIDTADCGVGLANSTAPATVSSVPTTVSVAGPTRAGSTTTSATLGVTTTVASSTTVPSSPTVAVETTLATTAST